MQIWIFFLTKPSLFTSHKVLLARHSRRDQTAWVGRRVEDFGASFPAEAIVELEGCEVHRAIEQGK